MESPYVMVRSSASEHTPVILTLHRSVWNGLVHEGAIPIGQPVSPEPLRVWAETCENPTGQKAAIARMLAGLLEAFPETHTIDEVPEPWGFTPGHPGTFWDAVAQR